MTLLGALGLDESGFSSLISVDVLLELRQMVERATKEKAPHANAKHVAGEKNAAGPSNFDEVIVGLQADTYSC